MEPLRCGSQKATRFFSIVMGFMLMLCHLGTTVAAQDELADRFPGIERESLERIPAPNYVPKKPGLYTAADWQTAIDTTWGAGLPDSIKLSIFREFWTWIDERFASFNGLSVDWDSVWTTDSAEIVGSVSRGRFSAMLDHASMALMEPHTVATDLGVYATTLAPGVPLMWSGGWGRNDHFGAGLTPLPDSSLLVYRVADGHPLGLTPGDLVLGYDGVPWKDLYPVLLEAQMPITGTAWGSSDLTFTHSMLMAAGLNWHLYDTIDVVKHASGDTVHLATSAMVGHNMSLWGTEQLDIPGVPMHDYPAGRVVSWGVKEGTQIGYIYCIYFTGDVEAQWFNAIDSLMHETTTTGLIIDLRTNYGGDIFLPLPGLELLFNTTDTLFDLLHRCSTEDHFDMCASVPPLYEWPYGVTGDSATYYDKPIALLTGPGAMSAGDFIAMVLAHHPRVKVFGKPTRGAFNSPAMVYDFYSGFYFVFARREAVRIAEPAYYLTHRDFPSAADFPWVPYEEVWLTPGNVAQGTDDVVEAAVAWINSYDRDGDSVIDVDDNCRDIANAGQENFDGDAYGDLCDDCPRYDVPGNVPVYTGDVNRLLEEVVINSSDIIYLVNFVFKSGPEPLPHSAAGDCTHDTNVNASDIIYLVNYVFKSGPEPLDACGLLPED